jgi:hypothetical protein
MFKWLKKCRTRMRFNYASSPFGAFPGERLCRDFAVAGGIPASLGGDGGTASPG